MLDENTCWMYQISLERAMREHLPLKQRQQYIMMMALLANQARKACPQEE